MISKKLTTEEYWNSTYRARFGISPVSVDTYKNYCAKCILKKKTLLVDQSGSILEIGGGGSPWIAFLASAFEAKQFATLDGSITRLLHTLEAFLGDVAVQHGIEGTIVKGTA